MKTVWTIISSVGLLVTLFALIFQGKIVDFLNKSHRGVSVIDDSDDDEK